MVCLCHYVLWVFQEKKKKHVAGEWPNGKYFIFSIYFFFVHSLYIREAGGVEEGGFLEVIAIMEV